jgi:NAD(P)-dependent dehydrogenase (short-subunit alcohol dehydrogenase family)
LADGAAASASVAVHPRLYPLSGFVPEVDLRDKVAVITGASTGIGRAAGEALAARGVHVIGTSRDVAGVRQRPGFTLLNLDVTQPKSINSFVRRLRRRIGAAGRVEILINNAGRGIVGDPLPRVGRKDRYFEQLELGIKTDYIGQLMMTNKMLPLLPTRGYARVYFTVSIGAYSVATNALSPLHVYIAVKRALLAFANAWSWTLQQAHRNISVATVNPYTTKTRWGYNIILIEKAPRGSTLAGYVRAVRESLARAQPASIVGEAYWQLLSTNRPPLNIAAGRRLNPTARPTSCTRAGAPGREQPSGNPVRLLAPRGGTLPTGARRSRAALVAVTLRLAQARDSTRPRRAGERLLSRRSARRVCRRRELGCDRACVAPSRSREGSGCARSSGDLCEPTR